MKTTEILNKYFPNLTKLYTEVVDNSNTSAIDEELAILKRQGKSGPICEQDGSLDKYLNTNSIDEYLSDIYQNMSDYDLDQLYVTEEMTNATKITITNLLNNNIENCGELLYFMENNWKRILSFNGIGKISFISIITGLYELLDAVITYPDDEEECECDNCKEIEVINENDSPLVEDNIEYNVTYEPNTVVINNTTTSCINPAIFEIDQNNIEKKVNPIIAFFKKIFKK